MPLLSRLRALPWGQAALAAVRFVWKRLHLLIMPIPLVLMLEATSRSSFRLVYEWILERPGEAWLNYWIALFLVLLAAGAIGRTRYAYGFLFLLFGTVGFLSGYKMNQTGAPLYVWDVLLRQSGYDTVREFNSPVTRGLLWATLAGLGVTVLALLIKEVRLKWQERLVYAAAGLFLLNAVYHDAPIEFWDRLGVITVHYEPVYNYQRNGFLAAVADGLHFVLPDKPAGTGSASIRQLVQRLQKEHPVSGEAAAKASGKGMPPAGAGDPRKVDTSATYGMTPLAAPRHKATPEEPNVIVLLSETFWDPTLLNNVTFSSDPIPFFRSMMKRTTSGWMLSPQFGGTTANVEFEVLTGNSVRFLPKDTIAYVNTVNRDVDSLASIFARQGYTTTAINPFYNWFFNSRNAYRSMGFSRFISSEFFEPRFHGPNYEDSQVIDKIIETTDHADGPSFVFANTMENHGGFEDKFYDHPITVSGAVSAKTKNMLENYATGENAFDKAFQRLVEHYEETDEPTVILCFGDHLPGFGGGYYGFKDAGYITGSDDPAFMEKMHFTPFVLWDNFTGKPREDVRTNASYLGTYLLHHLGKPGTYYTDMLYDLYQKLPILPIRAYRDTHPIDESMVEDYRRLQYDILFGSQAGYKEAGIAGHIRSPSFVLGYGNPVISGVSVDAKGRVEVTGDRFTSGSTVWLNGKPLRTTSYERTKLTAWLPDEWVVVASGAAEGSPGESAGASADAGASPGASGSPGAATSAEASPGANGSPSAAASAENSPAPSDGVAGATAGSPSVTPSASPRPHLAGPEGTWRFQVRTVDSKDAAIVQSAAFEMEAAAVRAAAAERAAP